MKKEEPHLRIGKQKGSAFRNPQPSAFYQLIAFEGPGRFSVDLTAYKCSGCTVLFLTPYQHFQWKGAAAREMELLQFHGDFYCIEYHKEEVACNGLLFNNVYLSPQVRLAPAVFAEVGTVFSKIKKEQRTGGDYSVAVLKAYLQLLLALCSREKKAQLEKDAVKTREGDRDFQQLLERYYLTERSPAFYAAQLSLSADSFSKKIRHRFGKTPSQLIQDRVILEAKRLLHLTRKSIKEIAAELEFEDVFYFSRYFKKHTGCAPSYFREQTGISIVAK
ncbi:helix-turn-helix domain-containing protein [Niabella beijingensis]|uniref:helix-turn-helix domain-containing protein n=1 Tax=Niabella beijingensis TaxID=2872700 RepID=UPI001CC19EA9|nr:helix-turn-helix transcriptional regulator [Niabella beijingensis]MBZ4187542.1 helix-turn-helix domain-containing protein [Niabella beijingensis]